MTLRFLSPPDVIGTALRSRSGRVGALMVLIGYLLVMAAVGLRRHGDASLVALIIAAPCLGAGFIVLLFTLIATAIRLGGEHIR